MLICKTTGYLTSTERRKQLCRWNYTTWQRQGSWQGLLLSSYKPAPKAAVRSFTRCRPSRTRWNWAAKQPFLKENSKMQLLRYGSVTYCDECCPSPPEQLLQIAHTQQLLISLCFEVIIVSNCSKRAWVSVCPSFGWAVLSPGTGSSAGRRTGSTLVCWPPQLTPQYTWKLVMVQENTPGWSLGRRSNIQQTNRQTAVSRSLNPPQREPAEVWSESSGPWRIPEL